MQGIFRLVLAFFLAAGLTAIAAVSWHSVGEIHYLKTFYPPSFTVEEAQRAAVVELIKVALFALPIVLGMGLALVWRAAGAKEARGPGADLR